MHAGLNSWAESGKCTTQFISDLISEEQTEHLEQRSMLTGFLTLECRYPLIFDVFCVSNASSPPRNLELLENAVIFDVESTLQESFPLFGTNAANLDPPDYTVPNPSSAAQSSGPTTVPFTAEVSSFTPISIQSTTGEFSPIELEAPIELFSAAEAVAELEELLGPDTPSPLNTPSPLSSSPITGPSLLQLPFEFFDLSSGPVLPTELGSSPTTGPSTGTISSHNGYALLAKVFLAAPVTSNIDLHLSNAVSSNLFPPDEYIFVDEPYEQTIAQLLKEKEEQEGSKSGNWQDHLSEKTKLDLLLDKAKKLQAGAKEQEAEVEGFEAEAKLLKKQLAEVQAKSLVSECIRL